MVNGRIQHSPFCIPLYRREALRFFVPEVLAPRAGALPLTALAFFFAPGLAVARAFAARFERAAGFLCETCRFGARRARGAAFAFGSFIVASIFTSDFDSSRQTPGVSFGSESGPMATRFSFMTGCPMAWNILRICCVR